MPKCLHPPCPNQVADALYCDEHKYIPHWTTNITVEAPLRSSRDWISGEGVPQNVPRKQHAPMLWLLLLVLILAILAVGLIVILKLIF